MFTWIAIYEEIARRILDFQNRQDELLSLLSRLRAEGLKVIQLNDRDATNHVIPLAEIDPLTFFSSFNRTSSIPGRQAILQRIKVAWNLNAPVPQDFEGIPLANAQNSWAFAYAANREPTDVQVLWRVAREAVQKDWRTFDRNLFNEALGISQMGLARMSMSLFWMKPRSYLSFDKNTRAYFERDGIVCKEKTAAGYISWLEKIVAKAGDNFPQLSRDAYLAFGTGEIENDEGDDTAGLKEVAQEISKRRYWILSAGEGGEMWDEFYSGGIAAIGWDGLGDLSAYKSKEDLRAKIKELWPADSDKKNDTHACWQFCHDIAPGDIIFAKQGTSQVFGYGVVEGGYAYDASRSYYNHVHRVKWMSKGGWQMPPGKSLHIKALTEMTSYPDYVAILAGITGLRLEQIPDLATAPTAPPPQIEPFTKADALAGLFMTESQLELILGRLKQKKALILQGPPGVGKTFVAKRLAYTLMGQKDEHRVCTVQFHPSYGYEDFIQGYRPSLSGGLERRNGVFYEFVHLAGSEPDRDWFFIIDEINRGNLAKIFGELLMLLEADKRGPEHQVSLTYSQKNERFHLPANLHVIGTMNTADRSLAMVDYALRRRFAFITLEPAVQTSAFGDWLVAAGAEKSLVDRIRSAVSILNTAIGKERDLGSRFFIGHSFFCPNGHKPDENWYRNVIQTEIKPLLEEYFDSNERVENLIAEILR